MRTRARRLRAPQGHRRGHSACSAPGMNHALSLVPPRRLPFGAEALQGGGVHLRVWAPRCERQVRRLGRHAAARQGGRDHYGVGSIAEIFDAEPPYTPRGCIAQAWSVAEALRHWVALSPDTGAPVAERP